MPEHDGRKAAQVLILAAGVQLTVMLTVNVPIVPVPVIERQLAVPPLYSQFIVTTYALVWGCLLLAAGRFADLGGRRRPLMAGLVLLSLGACIDMTAPDLAVLVVGRALQGGGAALVSTSSLSLLVATMPDGPGRRRAFALLALNTALGSVLGLVAGGALTSLSGWHSIFAPSFVLAIALAILAWRVVPNDSRSIAWSEFDVSGAITASAGIGLLVYAITQPHRASFGSIAELLAAVGLLVVFVTIERRARVPLLPAEMLTRRTVASGIAATLLIWSGFASMFFHLTFLLQQLLHYTPLQSALAYLPLALSTAFSGRIAAFGPFHDRLRWVMFGGGASIAAASAGLSLVGSGSSYVWPLLPCLLLAGIGLGLSLVSIQVVVFSGIPSHSTGILSGLLTTAQETASAIGTTILATLAVSIGGITGLRTALLLGGAAALAGGILGAALSRSQHADADANCAPVAREQYW